MPVVHDVPDEIPGDSIDFRAEVVRVLVTELSTPGLRNARSGAVAKPSDEASAQVERAKDEYRLRCSQVPKEEWNTNPWVVDARNEYTQASQHKAFIDEERAPYLKIEDIKIAELRMAETYVAMGTDLETEAELTERMVEECVQRHEAAVTWRDAEIEFGQARAGVPEIAWDTNERVVNARRKVMEAKAEVNQIAVELGGRQPEEVAQNEVAHTVNETNVALLANAQAELRLAVAETQKSTQTREANTLSVADVAYLRAQRITDGPPRAVSSSSPLSASTTNPAVRRAGPGL
jgi:hypothetical protein